jgi:hypothetical protein
MNKDYALCHANARSIGPERLVWRSYTRADLSDAKTVDESEACSRLAIGG